MVGTHSATDTKEKRTQMRQMDTTDALRKEHSSWRVEMCILCMCEGVHVEAKTTKRSDRDDGAVGGGRAERIRLGMRPKRRR